VVRGNLTGSSDIVIDGNLDGTISTTGDVTIGMNAQVKANVTATNITIAGNLVGDINASGQASIRETGNVHGDIRSNGLAITSGGIFVGRSLMEANANLSSGQNPLIGDGRDEDQDAAPKHRHHREP
jgi:cytoskeletal protein CcmA (bactofilin family)